MPDPKSRAHISYMLFDEFMCLAVIKYTLEAWALFCI